MRNPALDYALATISAGGRPQATAAEDERRPGAHEHAPARPMPRALRYVVRRWVALSGGRWEPRMLVVAGAAFRQNIIRNSAAGINVSRGNAYGVTPAFPVPAAAITIAHNLLEATELAGDHAFAETHKGPPLARRGPFVRARRQR